MLSCPFEKVKSVAAQTDDNEFTIKNFEELKAENESLRQKLKRPRFEPPIHVDIDDRKSNLIISGLNLQLETLSSKYIELEQLSVNQEAEIIRLRSERDLAIYNYQKLNLALTSAHQAVQQLAPPPQPSASPEPSSTISVSDIIKRLISEEIITESVANVIRKVDLNVFFTP